MQWPHPNRFVAPVVIPALLLSACAALPSDPESGLSSSGSNLGDATLDDLGYGPCLTAAALSFLNDSTTGRDALEEALDSRRVAGRILDHRAGRDEELGTWDDEPIVGLGEMLDGDLDISERRVRRFVEGLGASCEAGWAESVDWTGETPAPDFLHADSPLEGAGGWNRESSEIEVAMALRGLTGAQLHAIMESDDGFKELRRDRLMESFSYSLPPNEMPWTAKHHRAREAYPLVALTIEWGRYELDEDTDARGRRIYPELGRELSLGTDVMSDTYYDTRDFAGLMNDVSVRGRVRWDSPGCIRRLLVAAKLGSARVDPVSGIKEVFKVDVRTDAWGCNADEAQLGWAAEMDAHMRTGILPWSNSTFVAPPLRAAYARLAEEGALTDVSAVDPADPTRRAEFAGALALLPQAHVQSVRSRFHYNEASVGDLERLYEHGRARLIELGEYLDAAGTTGTPGVAGLRADIEEALAAIPERGLEIYPDEITRDSVVATAERAEEISDRLHAIGDILDADNEELLREVTNARDGTRDENRFSAFVAWVKIRHIESLPEADRTAWNLEGSIVTQHAVDEFRAFYGDSMSDPANPDHVALREEFNAYAEAAQADDDHPYHRHFRRFNDLDDEDDWRDLEAQLELEHFQIVRRQIEAAGSAARAIAFDAARRHYVPESWRVTSNFIIDTMDFSEYFSHRQWTALSAEQIDGQDLPADAVLDASLINEVQIELGSEAAFVERVAELDAELRRLAADEPDVDVSDVCELSDPGRASEVLWNAASDCLGAKDILDTYRGVLTHLAVLKGGALVDAVSDAIDDAGGDLGEEPDDLRWAPSTRSKGARALLLLIGGGTD
ncbi:MAG: hypothetical protein DRJ42_22890 [Deltaproteobacteria bacterium]|nr:MAG: hypothetical protein DRJ42_22890 [Deltaproteobacteria bacterium]